MAYNNYTKQTVFTDESVNSICNKIMDLLHNEFTSVVVDAAFCLTGTVAKIIQSAPDEDIKVIPYITNNEAIYKYCATLLPRFLGATAVRLNERIQLNVNGVYFEIWLTDSIGTINTVSDLKVQDPTDIPSDIN